MGLKVYEDGSLVFQSQNKGVMPYLEAIEALGSCLRGMLMVETFVSYAVALLILTVGYFLGRETEHIKMVDGRIYCPFEAMARGIDDPVQAYHSIVAKMESLMKAG